MKRKGKTTLAVLGSFALAVAVAFAISSLAAADTGTYNPSVTVSSEAPTITNVDTPSPLTLNAGGTKSTSVTVTVDDPNGHSTITNVNLSSTTTNDDQDDSPRTVASCTKGGIYDSTKANWTCSFNHNYYAEAATWNVEINAEDNSSNIATDTSGSYSIDQLDTMTLSNLPSFPTATPGSATEASSHLQLTNNGNIEYTQVNITAKDLTNASTSDVLQGQDFGVDEGSGLLSVDTLASTTAVTVTNAALNAGSSGNTETVYHQVTVPLGTEDYEYTASTAWDVTVS